MTVFFCSLLSVFCLIFSCPNRMFGGIHTFSGFILFNFVSYPPPLLSSLCLFLLHLFPVRSSPNSDPFAEIQASQYRNDIHLACPPNDGPPQRSPRRLSTPILLFTASLFNLHPTAPEQQSSRTWIYRTESYPPRRLLPLSSPSPSLPPLRCFRFLQDYPCTFTFVGHPSGQKKKYLRKACNFALDPSTPRTGLFAQKGPSFC